MQKTLSSRVCVNVVIGLVALALLLAFLGSPLVRSPHALTHSIVEAVLNNSQNFTNTLEAGPDRQRISSNLAQPRFNKNLQGRNSSLFAVNGQAETIEAKPKNDNVRQSSNSSAMKRQFGEGPPVNRQAETIEAKPKNDNVRQSSNSNAMKRQFGEGPPVNRQAETIKEKPKNDNVRQSSNSNVMKRQFGEGQRGSRNPSDLDRANRVSSKVQGKKKSKPVAKGGHGPTAGESLRSKILNQRPLACKKFRTLNPPSPDTPIPEPAMKICLSSLRDPCKAFSIGINYQWDFDDFALKLGCYVWSFDPSMRPGVYTRGPKHKFEHIGIAEHDGVNTGTSTLYKGSSGYKVATLKSLMAKHNCERLDIVRMDVEGAEWNVLEQWTRDWIWPRIGQLLLEVHMWNRGKSAGGVSRWARILNAIPMQVFHSARNDHSKDIVYVGLTSVWEVGFVSKKFGRRLLESSGSNVSETTPKFSDFNEGRLLSDVIDDLFKHY